MRRFKQSCLWQGNSRDLQDIRALFDQNIKVVIDLALDEQPTLLPREFVYCRFPILDGRGNPSWLLGTVIHLTAQLIQAEIPTLVACSMGMSRSPCIAAAALSRAWGGSADEYLAMFTSSGPNDIAPGLWAEVLDATYQLTRSAASPTPSR
jgi:hypothetical protein